MSDHGPIAITTASAYKRAAASTSTPLRVDPSALHTIPVIWPNRSSAPSVCAALIIAEVKLSGMNDEASLAGLMA
jgi:hypothetical protein